MAAVAETSPELLPWLVERRAPCSVLLAGASHVLAGRFEALDQTALTVLLFVEPRPRPGTGSIACVQYLHEGRGQVFLASVLTVVDDEGCYLSLDPPRHVANMDSRRAFRVPVEPNELPAEIVGPEGRSAAVVRDLSPLGVGLELVGAGDAPEVGDSVRVKLGAAERRRVLTGRVVQITGSRVGIAFTADVPSRIADLVSEAEARWRGRGRG